ncbi:hypothetical protein Tco_1075216 [Tanacetum coccineum]
MHRAKKKSIKQEYRGEGLLSIPADYMARGSQCPFPQFYVRALDGFEAKVPQRAALGMRLNQTGPRREHIEIGGGTTWGLC